MRLTTGIVILFAASLPTISGHITSARVSVTAYAMQDDAARTALIERFKQNRKTDHKAAYEAAKEFFRKYPGDTSEDGQTMKRWMTAYEKVEMNGQAAITGRAGTQPEEKTSEPTIEDADKFLSKVYSRQGLVDSTAPNKLTVERCDVSADFLSGNEGAQITARFNSKMRKLYYKPNILYIKETYSLSDINPQSVKLNSYVQNSWRLTFSFSISATGPHSEWLDPEKNTWNSSNFPGAGYYWVYTNEDDAVRSYKALVQGIKLCGAKKDPF